MERNIAIVSENSNTLESLHEALIQFPSVGHVICCNSLITLYNALMSESVQIIFLSDRFELFTAERVWHLQSNLRIIWLVSRSDLRGIEIARNRGVVGFICENELHADNVSVALRVVTEGDCYFSPAVGGLFSQYYATEHNPLSDRQIEVLEYMASYATPQEIAESLKISIKAVYSLQQRMRLSLGVETTTQIVMEALKRGLIKEKSA